MDAKRNRPLIQCQSWASSPITSFPQKPWATPSKKLTSPHPNCPKWWIFIITSCIGIYCFSGLSFGAHPQRLTAHPALDYQPSVSADGQTLAFVSTRSGNPDIWLKPLDQSGLALPRKITTHSSGDFNPALNRDGSRLLYVSHKSDPRGDIYLLDLITREERRLTDLSSSDTFPQWDREEKGFYYLKTNRGQGHSTVHHKQFFDGSETIIIPKATSYSTIDQDQLLYSQGSHIYLLNLQSQSTRRLEKIDTGLNLWPTWDRNAPPTGTDWRFFFTHYEQDSNNDGLIDADDESSIWMGQFSSPENQWKGLYRITTGGQFHAYPAISGDTLFFSDLKVGDIFQVEISSFLKTYEDLERAKALVATYQDTGHPELAHLVLANISQNLLGQVSQQERAAFDFSVAETHAQEGNFFKARQVVDPYTHQSGRIGALAKILFIEFQIQEKVAGTSSVERRRLVESGVAALHTIGKTHREFDEVYGEALIGAGKLYLFDEDPLAALDTLIQVDSVNNKEIKAKGLFVRAQAYQFLGDAPNVIQVYVDVIKLFGEQTSWGTRAIQQAISLTQKGQTNQDQIVALNNLASRYPDLPVLAATTRLHIADQYDAQGEYIPALDTLDSIISQDSLPQRILIQAYEKKAEILAESERYQEAANAYAALTNISGENQAKVEDNTTLHILQLVKKALKDRTVGEPRIAAKALRKLIDQYPTSVEAHRAYIEVKAQLKQIQEAQALYAEWVNAHPNHAVYQYGQALAQSYVEPLDSSLVIELLHLALEKDPTIGYIHQTLGWAYEQHERSSGEKGFLEKAEQEYRIALELNDAGRFPNVESQLLLNLGNTYLALSNFREAYRHYRHREEKFAPIGESLTELLYRKNYGEASFKSGRSPESITQYHLALQQVPNDQPGLQAEIWDRIGLAHQDLEQYGQAIDAYTHALEINRDIGQEDNVTLLQRNIGVNLFNLSQANETEGRKELKLALDSYLSSLERLTQKERTLPAERTGLINLQVALDEGGSQAARGFDAQGEEKLMFSYIASTYERLQEPGPSREFYEKKLALLNRLTTDNQDAASLTEKAIVLNRLGVLSHQLGQSGEAMEFFRQSLQYTRTLDIPFGISVNVYNLSRLAAENLWRGTFPDHSLLEGITSGIQHLHQADYTDQHLFFSLTNTALLLTLIPETPLEGDSKPEETIRGMYDRFTYKTLPWSYYRYAERLLEAPDVFPEHQRLPLKFFIKLNQAEITKQGQASRLYHAVQEELQTLVEEHHAPKSWLWYLAQAEYTTNLPQRKNFLTKAIDALLRFPPQSDPQESPSNTEPAYQRLSQLAVDQLIQDSQHQAAFRVSEQIRIRQLSSSIYAEIGEDFFLQGIGSYGPELKPLLHKLRQARRQGDISSLEELTAVLQDIFYALYEEYPWAAGFFWAYSPTKENLQLVLQPEHPYLKIMKGTESYHGFIHDGESLLYSPLKLQNHELRGSDEFHRRLDQSSSAYISIPPELESTLSSLGLQDKLLTRVTSCYDMLNGYHQRTLFFSRVTGSRFFQPSLPSNAKGIPFQYQILNGNPTHDGPVMAETDIAIFLKAPVNFKFEVQKVQKVRDFASVQGFGGVQHHSILLLGGFPSHSPWALISSLLRAGFSHVLISRTPLDARTAQHFLKRYLTYLNSSRTDKAVLLASRDIWGTEGRKFPIQLYGFAGMGPDEQQEYASDLYQEELDMAISTFEVQDFPTSLRHIERALVLMDPAQMQQDFNVLTTLAVETSFEVQDYEKGIFYQQQLLNTLTAESPLSERAEAESRLGILFSRLERFEEAVTHLEHANQLWHQEEELDRLADGKATLGVVRENMGAYPEALEQFHESFSLYQEIGEIGNTASQFRRMGRIHYLRLGRYEKARENFLAALEIFQEQGDVERETEVLYEIGLTYEKVGLFDQATQHYERGLTLAKELENTRLQATGYLYLANVSWFQSNYQTAFQLLSQANTHAQHIQDTQLQIMIKNTRGLMYWTLNDTNKGLWHLKEAVTLSETSGIKTELASSLNNLGLIYRQQGNHITALEYFERAKTLDESLKSQWGIGVRPSKYRHGPSSIRPIGRS